MDLVEFVRARLDEEQETAEVARFIGTNMTWRSDDLMRAYSTMQPAHAIHIARHDPARVLRDVQVWRRIVELHEPVDGYCSSCIESISGNEVAPCYELRLVASRWDDHPDYRDEWRPE